MYPRRYCLGLIEATARDGYGTSECARIRGVIASASLKPGGFFVGFTGRTVVSEALLPRPH